MSEDGLTESGRVVRKGGGAVVVEITGGQSCADCGLCSRAGDKRMLLEVRDLPSIDVGQAVRVTLPYRSKWRAILIVFALPLACFFAGGAAGAAAAAALGVGGAGEVLLAAALAFAGVAAAFVAARGADRRYRKRVFEETLVAPEAPGSTRQ